MYPQYMYILLYVKFIWCNSIPTISCHLGGIDVCLVYVHSVICESYVVWCYSRYLLSIGLGRSMYPQYMCILLYVTLSFGVMVFQISIVNWSVGYMYPQYMCILLYVKLIWCNGIPLIYCQLGGRCMLNICAFCYMCNLFGVTVFHTSIAYCSGG